MSDSIAWAEAKMFVGVATSANVRPSTAAAGLTVAVLAWDGVAVAVFAVGDQLKSDAASLMPSPIIKTV